MSLIVRSSKQVDARTLFWSKVEKIFGEIPKIIRYILEFNGFDSYLALKGIQWDDKKYFFSALEESVTTINDEPDDDDEYKEKIKSELAASNQTVEKFKLKLGHKNLIINLCNELQKTSFDDFNSVVQATIKEILEKEPRKSLEVVVKKQPIEEPAEPPAAKKPKIIESSEFQEVPASDLYEQVQYIYETEEDDDEGHYLDQTEYIDENSEIVEYQEVHEPMDPETDGIYSAEQIAKHEADSFEQSESYSSSNSFKNISSRSQAFLVSGTIKNSKKPKHMYNDEFLTVQNKVSAGTPSRRRPKIRKNYPDTEEGMTERWADLVRQSCEVIIPHDMLSVFDLTNIQIDKIAPKLWEVQCPMCSKKVRLQLTQEGKYVNFKRSNFERHLRVVHYRQIIKYQPREDEPEEVLSGDDKEEEMYLGS